MTVYLHGQQQVLSHSNRTDGFINSSEFIMLVDIVPYVIDFLFLLMDRMKLIDDSSVICFAVFIPHSSPTSSENSCPIYLVIARISFDIGLSN